MKNLTRIIALISFLLYCGNTQAQLTAKAGGTMDSLGICPGQSFTLGGNPTANGGTPPYTYQWLPDTYISCDTCANPVASPIVTTIYSVTVTDHLGDTVSSSAYVLVLPSPDITVTVTHDTANYFRTDTLSVSNGNGASVYYSWYANGVLISNSNNITYNYPGTFECIAVTNSYNHCTDTVVKYVQGGLTATVSSVTNNTCSYNSNGTINVSVAGGTGTYSYIWSNGATTRNLSDLPAGLYSLTVYDNFGNVGVLSQQVTSAPPIQVTVLSQLTGNFPDTLQLSVTGGNPPYSYSWNSLVTTSNEFVFSDGMYSCTVTDQSGCTASGQTIVGVVTNSAYFQVPENYSSSLPVLENDVYDLFPIITIATGPSHGSAVINSSQTVDYTPSHNFIGIDSFKYAVCVADSNQFDSVQVTTGYCDTGIVYITVIDSIVLSLQVQSTTCPGSCNGSITLQMGGGAAPYSFLWSHYDTSQNLSNLCPGFYAVTVTDANQAKSTASVIVDSSNLALTLYSYSDTLVANATYIGYNGDSSSYWIFTWSTGAVDTGDYNSLIAISQSGYYCVTATNMYEGCVLNACDTVGCIGCVWPGDCNDDGIVDNNDLLAIGLGYDSTGPARTNPTINWVGQQCQDWADTLLGGTNYKFIDCNGDGTINANDTTAVILNYDLTHLRGGGINANQPGKPELNIVLSADTVQNGDTLIATLSLGDSTLPVDNIYGIAFTFNYDPNVVDSTKTMINIGNSWLGNQTDRIYIAPNFNQTGQIEFAITRIDHVSRSGSGPIATVTFVITTDNINGRRSIYSYYPMPCSISDLTAVDNNGNVLVINEGTASGEIAYTSTGIKEIQNIGASVKIFPNPANDQLMIETDPTLTIKEIRITDLPGNLILSRQAGNSNDTVIDVSSLSSGAYFVEVVTVTGNIVKRFVITR